MNEKRCFGSVLLILLLIFPSLNAAENPTTEVINLQNRTAEQIIPLLNPFLKPEQKISADGFKLILQADRNTLKMFKELIKELDIPQTHLLVSIRNQPLSRNQSNTQTWRTQTEPNSETKTLELNDGGEGDLDVTLQVPMASEVETPFGMGKTYHYQTVTEKFHVKVQITPQHDHAQVEIRTTQITPSLSNLAEQTNSEQPPKLKSLESKTTLTIPLSTWIPISGRFDSLNGAQLEAVIQSDSDPSKSQVYQTDARDLKTEIAMIRVDVQH